MAASVGFLICGRMDQIDEDELLEAFSRVLRKNRLEAGLSHEELAHRADKSIRYISLLESRKHQPSLATLKKLCMGLGVSMTKFVSEIES